MDGDVVNVTAVNAAAHLDFIAGVAPAAPVVETVLERGEETLSDALLRANPDVRAALAAVDDAEQIEVVDRDSFTRAASLVAHLKKGARAAEDYKKRGRAPLAQRVKTFDGMCNAVIDAIVLGIARVNAGIVRWRQAEEVLNEQVRADANEAAAALQEQLAERARAAGLPEPPQVDVYVPPPPRTVDVDGGRITVQSRWTYEVEQPEAVPREFCDPAPGKLRAAVNAGVRSIPGVRIYQRDTTGFHGA